MKKKSALVLLSVFLLANTELHQLFKLPVLVHHFFEHHQDAQDKSFFHFLSDHYSSKPGHSHNDNNEHDNLPFKTSDCAAIHTSLAFNPHHHFSFCEPQFIPEKVLVPYNEVIYSSAILNSIWQPPQFS